MGKRIISENEMSEDKFPKIINGSCDGLGCGKDVVPCWCDQITDSKEEFQRRYDLQWFREWSPEGKENGCDIWYDAVNYTRKQFKVWCTKEADNHKREEKYASRIIGDNNETISILCDHIEDLEDKIIEVENESMDYLCQSFRNRDIEKENETLMDLLSTSLRFIKHNVKDRALPQWTKKAEEMTKEFDKITWADALREEND